MTNEETFQYLAEFPRTQVVKALASIGYSENAPEYPENIVGLIQDAIEAMNTAVQQQQSLAPAENTERQDIQDTPKEDAIVLQETTAIAAEILDARNISIPKEVLLAVAQDIISRSKRQADMLSQLQQQTFVKTLQNNQSKFAETLMQAMKEDQANSDALFSDENLAKLVNRAVPEYQSSFSVEEFLEEIKQQNLVQKEKVAVAANQEQAFIESKKTLDIDAFLEEFHGQ